MEEQGKTEGESRGKGEREEQHGANQKRTKEKNEGQRGKKG